MLVEKTLASGLGAMSDEEVVLLLLLVALV